MRAKRLALIIGAVISRSRNADDRFDIAGADCYASMRAPRFVLSGAMDDQEFLGSGLAAGPGASPPIACHAPDIPATALRPKIQPWKRAAAGLY